MGEAAARELVDGLKADTVDGYLTGEDRPPTVVEPKPHATGLTLDEIVVDHLDYLHHEAFFGVSPTFEGTVHWTLWFGLQYDSETVKRGETVGNGALVRWRASRRRLPAGAARGLKDVVSDMIDKGVFTPSTAR